MEDQPSAYAIWHLLFLTFPQLLVKSIIPNAVVVPSCERNDILLSAFLFLPLTSIISLLFHLLSSLADMIQCFTVLKI